MSGLHPDDHRRLEEVGVPRITTMDCSDCHLMEEGFSPLSRGQVALRPVPVAIAFATTEVGLLVFRMSSDEIRRSTMQACSRECES